MFQVLQDKPLFFLESAQHQFLRRIKTSKNDNLILSYSIKSIFELWFSGDLKALPLEMLPSKVILNLSNFLSNHDFLLFMNLICAIIF